MKLENVIESHPWCRRMVGSRRRVVRSGSWVIGGGMVGSRRVGREGDSHENCRKHKSKHLLVSDHSFKF